MATAHEPTPGAAVKAAVVRDLGFTVLFSGVAPIVEFVHETILVPVARQTKTKTQRALVALVPMDAFWPRDLLPDDSPEARILTYGYDSRVSNFFRGPASQNNIGAHGRALLHALEARRRDHPTRRLSLLRIALRRSKVANQGGEDLQSIYTSTYAIIFMGTPHRGSSYAELGLTAQRLAKAMGFDTNDELLRNLKFDGSYLELLREEFSKMLDQHIFKVYTFQEGKGYKGIQGMSRKIVDDASSSLEHSHERKDFINENHVMMCRFASRDDDGYIKLRDVITSCTDGIRKREEQKQEVLHDRILRSLRPDAMDNRKREIERPHRHTFDWVFTDRRAGFQSWLEGDAGLFWIKGKPGSGKSTLMKYVLSDRRTTEGLSCGGRSVLSISSFFFHDRGVHETQKSFEGLLRSIIYQLLCDIRSLAPLVVGIHDRHVGDRDKQSEWSIEELEEALRAIIKQHEVRGYVCLFIDALDEYKGNLAWVTRFIKELVTPTPDQVLKVRICASSRDRNVIGLLLSENPRLTLHEWTMLDIQKFADESLAEAERDGYDQLLEEITHRAEGVFLWVKLVVEELMEPLFDGEPIEDLLKLVSDLPEELPAFYDRMFSKVTKRNRRASLVMIELVLASEYKPILLEEFSLATSLALSGGLPADIKSSPVEEDTRRDEMIRRIKACSGGLLEVVGDGANSHVQFIHQTVKSFVERAQNRESFGGKSASDLAFGGLERAMWLTCCVIRQRTSRSKHGTSTWHDNPQFYCGNFKDGLLDEFLKLIRAMQSISRLPSQAMVDNVLDSIAQFIGPSRLEMYWGANDVNRFCDRPMCQALSPTSFLDLAVLNGLTSFAERQIAQRGSSALVGVNTTKLLYYAIVGILRIVHVFPDVFVSEQFLNDAELWYRFIKFGIRNSFDPNGILMLRVSHDEGIVANYGQSEQGLVEPITLLQYTGSVAFNCRGSDQPRSVDFLDTLHIIMKGEDVSSNLGKFWFSDEPISRPAVRYFLPKGGTLVDPFRDQALGRALVHSLLAFLDYGLSPNARYSNGMSIFETAVLVCNYGIVKDMLERGAKVTPGLITDEGTPVPGPCGILHEMRWIRPEIYTREAIELVCQQSRPNSNWDYWVQEFEDWLQEDKRAELWWLEL
ncbi:hypothetical protein B0T10DRAFT_538906 [Thelonectria olida]|uniref:Nephrocystin 3-like N-terminal domain-containing protein n=1 Tax=Thelonectria olida TaxID=1576542 RepID=A0A9P8W3V0_9HYPO|nr:hypothetical protein B0T10DRAFT_538906 [Thelonectria olida]